MATLHLNKVLVFTKRSNQSPLIQAAFSDCILKQLGLVDEEEALMCKVNCYVDDNKLILESSSEDDSSNRFILKHPPFCPLVEISSEEKMYLSEDVKRRGVDVGVAVILSTADDKILLTRRAPHMRTFPGVWVPPGGHIELNETLEEAGLRELNEETGLTIPSSMKTQSTILALWESVFPPILPFGLPSRHHIVVYWLIKVNCKSSDLEKNIKLNPDEVDASFWMPLELAESVVAGVPFNLEKIRTLQYMSVEKDGEQSYRDLDPNVLLKKMPPPDSDVERVSTGTRFAIEMWSLCKDQQTRTKKSNL